MKKIYHLASCSTCQRILKQWKPSKNVLLQDIKTEKITPNQLDELAKLARAAAIHIIMATQKAVKESLDTKTLENLNGRIAFKMSTHAGSNTALGNVDAYALPDIKGRAIWNGGNKFLEVQTPFLSEEELDLECKALAEKMTVEGGGCFGPMLDVSTPKAKEDEGLKQVTNDEVVT